MSSFIPISRSALRRCRGRRFISSEVSEKVQNQAPRVPISTDFHGIQIFPSPRVRRDQTPINQPIARPVDFARGASPNTIPQKYHQSSQSQARGQEDSSRVRQTRSYEATEQDVRMEGGVRDGEQRAWRRTDADRGQYRQDEDAMQMRRTSRPGSGSSPRRRRRRDRRQVEMEEEELIDEDGEDYVEPTDFITVIQPRRPDVPLPKRVPAPPPPLTNLETHLSEKRTKRPHEHQGGDYTRHFSHQERGRVRAQTVSSLGVLDRARLALSFNRTIGVASKRVGIELVGKSAGKAAIQ